jgi:hypothetical protein
MSGSQGLDVANRIRLNRRQSLSPRDNGRDEDPDKRNHEQFDCQSALERKKE